MTTNQPTPVILSGDLFKSACRLHTAWTIDRYLMSNAHNRFDPAEKAERHIELCQFYVAAVRGCLRENAMRDYAEDFDRLHEESQDLTSALDTEIGFPLNQTPDYADLNPKFFERFHAIACRVLGVVDENTALREQLAEAQRQEPILTEQITRLAELAETRSDIIAAKTAHVDDLESRLAQVEKERDDVLNRSHQTVLFDCGCMFKQEGLDAEPMLVVHCAAKEQP